MQFAAALVWPALALVFAGAFLGLWRVDQSRSHLLGFAVGFLALFLVMTVIIAFPSVKQPYVLATLHGLSCASVTAIVWGAVKRLSQRVPLFAMSAVTLASCVILYSALEDGEHQVALFVQNETSGLLFGIGVILLWTARSTNLLDRLLVWTMGLLVGFSLLRPLALLYLHVEVAPLVASKIELVAINVIVPTVLTVVLGGILVAIAIQEALEIRHSGQRSDPVTGFLDQHTFEQSCEPALATAQRLSMPVTLVVLKLDWFEKIMEKWGANTSDAVVREISDVVRSWQRDSDVIGRVGEDQFGILLVGVSSKSAQKIISKLRQDIDQACNERMSGLLKFTLSSSIVRASNGMTFPELLRGTLTPLVNSHSLGSNVSFVNGIEIQHADFEAPQDGTFVTHG